MLTSVTRKTSNGKEATVEFPDDWVDASLLNADDRLEHWLNSIFSQLKGGITYQVAGINVDRNEYHILLDSKENPEESMLAIVQPPSAPYRNPNKYKLNALRELKLTPSIYEGWLDDIRTKQNRLLNSQNKLLAAALNSLEAADKTTMQDSKTPWFATLHQWYRTDPELRKVKFRVVAEMDTIKKQIDLIKKKPPTAFHPALGIVIHSHHVKHHQKDIELYRYKESLLQILRVATLNHYRNLPFKNGQLTLKQVAEFNNLFAPIACIDEKTHELKSKSKRRLGDDGLDGYELSLSGIINIFNDLLGKAYSSSVFVKQLMRYLTQHNRYFKEHPINIYYSYYVSVYHTPRYYVSLKPATLKWEHELVTATEKIRTDTKELCTAVIPAKEEKQISGHFDDLAQRLNDSVRLLNRHVNYKKECLLTAYSSFAQQIVPLLEQVLMQICIGRGRGNTHTASLFKKDAKAQDAVISLLAADCKESTNLPVHDRLARLQTLATQNLTQALLGGTAATYRLCRAIAHLDHTRPVDKEIRHFKTALLQLKTTWRWQDPRLPQIKEGCEDEKTPVPQPNM